MNHKKQVHVEPGALLFLHTDFSVKCLKCVLFSRIRGSLFTVCVHFFFSGPIRVCEKSCIHFAHNGKCAHTHTQLHTHLECYWNTREYFTCLLTDTHTQTYYFFAPGIWQRFTRAGAVASGLHVCSIGNRSSYSKCTGSHMTFLDEEFKKNNNNKNDCVIALCVLFCLPSTKVALAMRHTQQMMLQRSACPNNLP